MNNTSLRVKSLLLAIFLVLVVIVASIFIAIVHLENEEKSLIESRVGFVAQLQSKVLSSVLWQLDIEGASVFLKDLSLDQDFKYAEIHSPDGKLLLSNGVKPQKISAFLKFESPIVFDNQGQPENLGVLTLIYSRQRLENSIKSLIIGGTFTALILVIVISGVIIGSFRLYTRPLGRMTSTMTELAGGDLEIKVADLDRADEIGQMARAIQVFKNNAVEVDSFTKTLEKNVSDRTKELRAEIEQRSQIEDKLRHNQQVLEDVADLATDWFWETDANLAITQISEQFFGKYNFLEEEVIFKSWTSIISSLDLVNNTEACVRFESALSNRVEFENIEIILPTADENNAYINLIGKPFFDKDGEFAGYRGAARDITVRKIIQKNLEKAVKKADSANQAKSEFLSSMSHELRTPLNAILGFSGLLLIDEKNPLTDDQKGSIEYITKGGEHLLSLINDVLDLAKIEAGNATVSIEGINTQETVKECIEIVAPSAESRSVKIDFNSELNEFPEIKADQTRTKQIILNFLSNAIKYGHEGGNVEIGGEARDGRLKIFIKDDGPGIPEEKQAYLFQPFNRLGMEASEVEGTGIGLTITKRLLELMDGNVGFSSKVGEGSIFWFELPLYSKKLSPGESVAEANETRAVSLNGKKSVLYIEDNPANYALMEKIFSNLENVSLTVATDAESGLDIIEQNPPDLILLDINLPGMDGYQALEVLKTYKSLTSTPVIAITANAMPSQIKKGMAAGFTQYLIKPIDISETLAAVNSALDG